MSAHDDAKDERVLEPAARLVPRKLSLRVSGARIGDAVRPAASSEGAVGPRRPAPRFGLRVHARFGVVPETITVPATEPDDDGGAR